MRSAAGFFLAGRDLAIPRLALQPHRRALFPGNSIRCFAVHPPAEQRGRLAHSSPPPLSTGGKRDSGPPRPGGCGPDPRKGRAACGGCGVRVGGGGGGGVMNLLTAPNLSN